jgi:hypothetical protein
MRCELEHTLKSRQRRREAPDFSFRHRPNGRTCVGTTDHAREIKAPNAAVCPLCMYRGSGDQTKLGYVPILKDTCTGAALLILRGVAPL